MKKITGILIAGLFVLGLTGAVMAQNNNHNVEVTIDDIALIDASVGPITLTLTTATAGENLGADQDASGTLSFSHNQATQQVITAVATEVDVNATQDVTLQLTLQNGDGQVNLITSGAIQGAKTLRDNIARGAYDVQTLTYDASATLSGSVPYTNIWQITFTMQDT
ncbi:hypothetical protein MUP95_07925 [bacterium]|nr:hypothetical protein [bacterium]